MYLQADGHDITTDIVIVGTGPAGLAALGAAVENGSSVIVLEASNRPGGNGVYSTGWVAFVDSAMQRQYGLKDTEEIFLADCQKMVNIHQHLYGIMYDETLAKVFARGSAKMYDRLVARGVRFTSLATRPQQASVDRLHVIEDTEMFVSAFEPELEGDGVKTYLNTAASRLITDTHGSVTGVIAKSAGSPNTTFRVNARKGVILATGGYQANGSFRRRYQLATDNASPYYAGISTSRGDGHMLGASVGGDLINMNVIPPIVIVASALVQEAIAVNADGNRFMTKLGLTISV